MVSQEEQVDFGFRRLHVEPGSLLRLSPLPEAIASSDDNELSHGGGVSRAIWLAAQFDPHDESVFVPPDLGLGDVHVTPAGRLAAKHVLHAAHCVALRSRSMRAEKAAKASRAASCGATSS